MIKFKKHLKNISFSEVLKSTNPNEAYDNFIELFRLLYNLCFPIQLINIKSDKKIKWISRGIRTCSQKQRQLLWKYRKSPSIENKNKFKLYSQTFKKIVKLKQKAQNNHIIKKAPNKSKASWQIINGSNQTKDPIRQIKIGNSIIRDAKEIADSFNNFFVDQVQNSANNNNNEVIRVENNPNSLFMSPAIPDDIIRIINILKNKKSFGYDGIAISVVKFVADVIARPLCHIMNLCINTGIFPNSLKSVIIKPLHKKDSKEDMSNYRPVALVSVFSKIFEKLIYESIFSFLDKFNILSNEQKGFRKNKNINMAIYDLLHNIMTNVDKKTPVCAIFTDMTKAFDYVNHNILLQKLDSYGIRGNVLSLIKSYLSNRKQQTEISRVCARRKLEFKYLSDSREVKFGVPQGSVIAAPLFLMYINDLPRKVQQPMVLFADDSTAIVKCVEKANYENDINDTLKAIINWLNTNNLIINLQKTKIMHFFQRLHPDPLKIEYNGQNIDKTNVAKFLGIVIDSQLTWKQQAEEVCKKLSRGAYILYNLSKKVNIDTIIIAYHGLVASILRYGVIFWGNCSERERVFRAQKYCLRSMTGINSTDSCIPMFKSLKLLTFPSLYILEVALFVKMNLNLFETTINHSSRPALLRSQYKGLLHTGSFKTALLRKNIMHMGPVIYNKIPNDIKNDSSHFFKKKLTKLLVEKCYYTVSEFLNDNTL